MDDRTRGGVEMATAMAISGTIGWVVIMSRQPILDVVFWRCAFGAAALLIVCAALGLLRQAPPKCVLVYASIGGAAIVLNWLLLFASFSRASISISTAVYSAHPFILVALGAAFFGERPSAAKIMWLVVAFIGVLLIIQAKPPTESGADYVLGVAMALSAAFFYAVAIVAAKKLAGAPPLLIALIQVCVGVAMLAPIANFGRLPDDGAAWGALIALGVVYTGLLFTLQYDAVQRLPTHVAGSLYFIYPLVAFLVDFVAFGQRMQPTQIVGAAAIVIAAAGGNLSWPVRRPHRASNPRGASSGAG